MPPLCYHPSITRSDVLSSCCERSRLFVLQVSISTFQAWHDWSRGLQKRSVATRSSSQETVPDAELRWSEAFAVPLKDSRSLSLITRSGKTDTSAAQAPGFEAAAAGIRGRATTITMRGSTCATSGRQPVAKHVVNTYLQLVGRELLSRAYWLQPLFRGLPLAPPTSATAKLFVEPFMAALEHALDSLLQQPAACISAYVDEQAMDPAHKRYQHLQPPSKSQAITAASTSRSPMSLLAYLAQDGMDFLGALRRILRANGCSLPVQWCMRALDAPFLARRTSIQAMVSDYVMHVFQVLYPEQLHLTL
jgi:hypothetical protein